MGWVRLDDRITEHPKVAAAGPYGLALFVAALAYCNRNLTDGFIPRSVAATLLDDGWTDVEGVHWKAAAHSNYQTWDLDCIDIADHLVDVGLFDRVDGNAHVTRYGFRIHDYEDYQPSRARVLAEREKTAQRVQRHREGRTVEPKQESQGNAKSNAVSNAPVTAPPTPTPKREANASLGRARDDLWDALVAEIGDVETKDERGARNKAVKQLREIGATPDDVRQRCAQYRRTWPQLTLTDIALVKHWSRMAPAALVEAKPIDEVLGLPEVSDEERETNARRVREMASSIGKDVA